MKKRIHLSNICVGMYIEELEDSSINGFDKRRLLITSQAELRIILASNAMSAIIDTAKGKDVCEAADPSWELIRARFEAELESSFHAGEIRQARECIESTRPMIRQMLSSAHRDGSFDFDGAHGIVEAVMSDALESAGALIAMTKSVAYSFADRGVRVNAVAPGVVNTDMVANMPQFAKDSVGDTIPMKRFAEPEDIANGILFLSSSAASYVTGVCLQIDGGYRPNNLPK